MTLLEMLLLCDRVTLKGVNHKYELCYLFFIGDQVYDLIAGEDNRLYDLIGIENKRVLFSLPQGE